MGKLQYVNRKIDGLKLGQVVAKDIIKRIPPGSGSRSAARDPQIELDVSQKSINDEAVAFICEALVRSVSHPAKNTRLEELRLRKNTLTAKCLGHLGRVIKASAAHIQDIDLSANKICIASHEDAKTWEEFLTSFRNCTVLRRLDLSGNPLGAKAFEILAKVYAKEKDTSSKHSERHASSRTLVGAISKLDLTKDDGQPPPKDSPSLNRENSPKQLKFGLDELTDKPVSETLYAMTSGLRSVPYIIFNDCEMTDECALHLSYVLEKHPLAADLNEKVPSARPGEHLRQIEAYHAVDGCNGIIWTPNKDLTEHGNRVLQLAEVTRNNGENVDSLKEEAMFDLATATPGRSSETSSPFAPVSMRARHDSVSTVRSTPQSAVQRSLRADPLRSARSRIQGDILRDWHCCTHDLWRKALEMLSMSRPLLLEAPHEEGLHEIDRSPERSHEIRDPATPRSEEKAFPLTYVANLETDQVLGDNLWPRIASKSFEAAPVSKPTVFRLGINKRGQSKLEPDSQVSVNIPEARRLELATKEAVTARTSLKLPETVYRTCLPKGLSSEIWGHIFAYATNCAELLSKEQQGQVVEYARRRRTLQHEIESRGKLENAQIWRALEGMGCLAYQ